MFPKSIGSSIASLHNAHSSTFSSSDVYSGKSLWGFLKPDTENSFNSQKKVLSLFKLSINCY